MGAVRARSKASVGARVESGAGGKRAALKWDEDEPVAAKAPVAPTAKMLQEEEAAIEIEDDIDAVDLDGEDLDVW